MHKKTDFGRQEIDDVCYVTCAELVARTGRSRTAVFYDIQKGLLPATWGLVRKGERQHATRAWVIHPKDADDYAAAKSPNAAAKAPERSDGRS